jgi:uncharacterized protein YbjT (DUF2867 family)
MTRPLIAVLGATSAAGTDLVRTLLASGEFRVRAVTRDPRWPEAGRLAALGAELACADLDDFGFGLEQALRGTQGVICVVPPARDAERQRLRASALSEAARRAGIARLTWVAPRSANRDWRTVIDALPVKRARVPEAA